MTDLSRLGAARAGDQTARDARSDRLLLIIPGKFRLSLIFIS
jgi:hypothetical protein